MTFDKKSQLETIVRQKCQNVESGTYCRQIVILKDRNMWERKFPKDNVTQNNQHLEKACDVNRSSSIRLRLFGKYAP